MIEYKNIKVMGDNGMTSKHIAHNIKNSSRCDEYRVGDDVILVIQDYAEQYPYVLALSKAKYEQVSRIIDSEFSSDESEEDENEEDKYFQPSSYPECSFCHICGDSGVSLNDDCLCSQCFEHEW